MWNQFLLRNVENFSSGLVSSTRSTALLFMMLHSSLSEFTCSRTSSLEPPAQAGWPPRHASQTEGKQRSRWWQQLRFYPSAAAVVVEGGGTVCNHWEKKKRWICKKKNSAQLGKSGQSFLRLPLTAIIRAQLLPKPQLFQRKPWAAGTQLPTLDTPASPQFHCGVLTWPFQPRYGSAAKRGHPLWYLTPFHLGTASPLRNSVRGWFPRWAPCPLIAVNTKPHGISPRFGKCHVWERRA